MLFTEWAKHLQWLAYFCQKKHSNHFQESYFSILRRFQVLVPDMDSMLDNLSKTEFISICVRDPRVVKHDLLHTHIDYEICLQTNSMCFRKKTSRVRRRYSEFVWLRHRLERNALMIELPKLPPWKPFFSLRSAEQVSQRMKGMQEFLENVLHAPLLLSDSRLHLFLQSDLSITKIERCALGKTRYTVAEAIQRSNSGYIVRIEDKSCDSDCESSSSSSGLGLSGETLHVSPVPFFESSDRDPELLVISNPPDCTLTDSSFT